MIPDGKEWSRKITDAAAAGNNEKAIRLMLSFLAQGTNHHVQTLGVVGPARWSVTDQRPWSARFRDIADSLVVATDAETDNDRKSQLKAATTTSLAVSEAMVELETCSKDEMQKFARLMLVGAGIGFAMWLENIGEFITLANIASKAQRSKSGATIGGKNSGHARRAKAAATWQPHAEELAAGTRRDNPKASQDDVVEEIQFGWKSAAPAPGPKTLKRFVSSLERAGKLPPRRRT